MAIVASPPLSTVETFGARLRTLRQQAGLSQTALGGGQYSASYISYLENGRRQPTEELIIHLATTLGVPSQELTETDRESYVVGSAAISLQVADAALREAQRVGDPRLICDRAVVVSARALEAHRSDLWWQAEQSRMHALVTLGHFTEAADIGSALVGHPIARGAAQLACEVLAVVGRCHRALGRLDRALAHTAQALERLAGEPVAPPVQAEVLIVRVATLMDAGQIEEAVTATTELRQLSGQVDSDQLRGQIAWVLGNVGFMTEDVAAGLQAHALAEQLFRPEVDLGLWARFRQASARMRLEVGLLDGVDQLVESAALALSLVGGPGDLANLEMVRAGQALARGEAREALLLADAVITEPSPLSPQSRADVHMLRHLANLALEDVPAARQALREAALLYETADAWQRAAGAWRIRAELEAD